MLQTAAPSDLQARYEAEISALNPVRAASGDGLWDAMRQEAEANARAEPVLASFLHATMLNHDDFQSALSYHLANKLGSAVLPAMTIRETIEEAMAADSSICKSAQIDVIAIRTRDAACNHYSEPFLYHKGFHAIQAHRVAHWLWLSGREQLALFMQNQISAAWAVDIHPGARIGCGIMFDHATSIVVGETAVIEDDVSMLHEVTLGGTGKDTGDRHPKIRAGVLLSAGSKIIGNIEVGAGAKVGAGSVVLEDVPPHVTVAGVPARIVGRPMVDLPALNMDQSL